MTSLHEAQAQLLRAGFRIGYAQCNGRWVKCHIPPNAIGLVRIPYRLVQGMKTSLGWEEVVRLPQTFICND